MSRYRRETWAIMWKALKRKMIDVANKAIKDVEQRIGVDKDEQ